MMSALNNTRSEHPSKLIWNIFPEFLNLSFRTELYSNYGVTFFPSVCKTFGDTCEDSDILQSFKIHSFAFWDVLEEKGALVFRSNIKAFKGARVGYIFYPAELTTSFGVDKTIPENARKHKHVILRGESWKIMDIAGILVFYSKKTHCECYEFYPLNQVDM